MSYIDIITKSHSSWSYLFYIYKYTKFTTNYNVILFILVYVRYIFELSVLKLAI